MALTPGKITRTASVPSGGQQTLEDVPPGAAVPDVVVTSLPANGVIAALSVSNPPTQAEVVAIRDAAENVRDALAAAIVTITALSARLRVTGGNGIIADS